LSAGLDRQWRRRAISTLRLSGRETLLDLCTGTGDLALAATEGAEASHRARRVIGIDFSGEMLRIAQRKAGAQPIHLLRGDATQIPLAGGSVDAVTIGFGIRNVERPLDACREIARVLRPNGTLVILEFSLPRSAVLRNFYLSYFRRVLPLIGRVISRHKTAYSYLPESVEAFPSPEEFSRQLRESGFGTVNAVPLTFGVVYMFVAVKGERLGRVV
jgi:demethylmenaquinone methyltransferase/2-methoxy-6-polyprenyl-1,4-benzoquinol methylase